MTRYLVVGAGISGAALANRLSESDCEVAVIERRLSVGGVCHDHRDDSGIMVHDYGSHIFHTSNERVWRFINQFAVFNAYEHHVMAAIDDTLIPLPFSFESIRRSFPEDVALRLEDKLLDRYPEGAEVPISTFLCQDDEDLRSLAQYVYNRVFLHYTEKQWGRRPEDMDKSVTGRVPVRIGEDTRFFRDRYQGIPMCGYTELISRMLDCPNIELRLNTTFRDVDDPNSYDRIFYTGRVDELMEYSLGRIPYRSERFVFETCEQEFYQETAVVNYPEAEGFTRVHEFKHYLGEKSPVTIIAREYPEEFVPGKNDPLYPVPIKENERLHAEYVKIAKEKYPNMSFLGRLGDYRYYNMDRAVARALDIADHVRS